MFTTFSRHVALETPVNPEFLSQISNGVSIMRIVFAVAIGITVCPSAPAAHADRRYRHHSGWHPDNIYVTHCRGGWVSCGRDSAKHHQDTNPQQQ